MTDKPTFLGGKLVIRICKTCGNPLSYRDNIPFCRTCPDTIETSDKLDWRSEAVVVASAVAVTIAAASAIIVGLLWI